MTQPMLAELTTIAATAEEPSFTHANPPKFGGVDPLGLRQVNFDLMDEVLPGLNNIARHIRPFVVVTWAWRRAIELAKAGGREMVDPDLMQDFVDRIEVIYVWSQLLHEAAGTQADLPGRQVLGNLVGAPEYKFGGSAWQKRRKDRRYSTALSAPINYGPGLKMLGWVRPHPKHRDIMEPTEAAIPAVDAFEKQIAGLLEHPAFSEFGSVIVTRDEARSWASAWTLNGPTKEEANVMAALLFGQRSRSRQLAGELILGAASYGSTKKADELRGIMSGPPSSYTPPGHLLKTWADFRHIQMRQLFRLTLEALFYWTLSSLEDKPQSVDSLVELFLSQVPSADASACASDWLKAVMPSGSGPTELITATEVALDSPSGIDLAPITAAALSFCLVDEPQGEGPEERHDRMPISRARREAVARADEPVRAFLRHVFESWILAQHVYWSVGRGLADARAQGKTLMRLRVVLDEAGWELAPGATRGSRPSPTPDRLHTAVSLAEECGLFNI